MAEEKKVVEAQQGVGAQQVAVPIPNIIGSVVAGGYDPQDGSLRALNLDTLRQLQVLAERRHALDRADARNALATATIGAGSAVGATARARITVPEGEVWYVSRATHVSPAESGGGVGDIVQTNFRVSKWADPASDADGKLYNAAGIGTAAVNTTDEDFAAAGELGEELRLEAGDVVTLVATLTGAVAGADLAATLTLFGRRGKRLMV